MKTGRQLCGSPRRRDALRAGFSLLDVLVSITVIAILIGILIPKMSHVHESARRVICQSNVRQIGIGVMTFANEHGGLLPSSQFLGTGPGRANAAPQDMDTLRLATDQWDGLGILFNQDYINAAKVFYCPSHRGQKPFAKYAPIFSGGSGEILSNYHYRGEGPMGHGPNGPRTRNLDRIDPAYSSLVADGMQLRSDYNHRVGSNFFRADLSVHWFSDPGSQVTYSLPTTKDQANMDQLYVPQFWNKLDQSANEE